MLGSPSSSRSHSTTRGSTAATVEGRPTRCAWARVRSSLVLTSGSWLIRQTLRSDTSACAATVAAESPAFRRIWISWRVMAPINPPPLWGAPPQRASYRGAFLPLPDFPESLLSEFLEPATYEGGGDLSVYRTFPFPEYIEVVSRLMWKMLGRAFR